MSMSLAGKTAIVTGAASGVGRGICEALRDEGATVYATDIQEDPLRELVGAADLAEDRAGADVALQCRLGVVVAPRPPQRQGQFVPRVECFGRFGAEGRPGDLKQRLGGVFRDSGTVVFDLDGTLADTAAGCSGACRHGRSRPSRRP